MLRYLLLTKDGALSYDCQGSPLKVNLMIQSKAMSDQTKELK